MADFQAEQASCSRALSSPIYRTAETSRLGARAVLEADISSHFRFNDAMDPDMEALRTRYGFTTSQLTSSGAQAAIAAQALIHGVSRVVTVSIAGGLDTHFDNWEDEQALRQYNAFEALANLAQHLEETPYGDSNLLDYTTIAGFSEFTRTPLINARGGRDHWITNSVLLMGGNIAPKVVGASSDIGMAPQPIDRTTGAVVPSEAGEIIYPEHIWRTLLVDAGLAEDRADLRVEHLPVLLKS